MFSENGEVKIIDLGFSKIYKNKVTSSRFQGTTLYSPPEIIEGKPYNIY